MSSNATIGSKGVPRADRERQIIAAAITEFAATGYSRASMVTIATRAGISKPLVYQYFGSKDALYLRCLRQVSDGLLSRLEAAELSVDDTTASRILPLQAVFDALEPQREAWKLLFDATMPPDGPIAQAATDYRARTSEIATIGSERFLLARGMTDALDAAALSAVWTGLVDSLVTWWIEYPDVSADQMTERCIRLFAAVLE